MKIETIATANLIPYARNAKAHTDAQVAQIAGSIKEFGFNAPVLIDPDNGIIAGHGRVLAAHKLKLDKVPCIRLGHLTPTQRRAYMLADNKIGMNTGWDDEMLSLELVDLREENYNFDLIGFDADSIEAALNPGETVADVADDWKDAGMPDYDGEPKGEGGTIIVHFPAASDRERFFRTLGITGSKDAKFCWYPARPQ